MTDKMPDEIWCTAGAGGTHYGFYGLKTNNDDVKYIRADLCAQQNSPATSDAANSSGTNASLKRQAEPHDDAARGALQNFNYADSENLRMDDLGEKTKATIRKALTAPEQTELLREAMHHLKFLSGYVQSSAIEETIAKINAALGGV